MLTHAPSETLILRPDPAGAGVNGPRKQPFRARERRPGGRLASYLSR